MKTLLKITILAFLLTAFSCSKDVSPTQVTQQINEAPTVPILTAPSNGENNVDVTPTFIWQASTDANGDTITYEVFADNSSNPNTLIGTTTNTSLEVTIRLPLLESLNWKIIAKDGIGGETQSNVQSFETRNIITSNATTAPGFDERILHSSTIFNNKVWVIGGLSLNNPSPLNDVWNSEDGVTWNLITASAGFAPRNGHKIFVLNNKLWLIGGFVNGVGNTKEVWNTDDGITWNLVNSQAGFSSGSIEDVIVFDNKMWVMNGDVWFSEDGLVWSLAQDNLSSNGSATVYQNKLWTIDDNGTNIHVSEDGFNWTIIETNITSIVNSFDSANFELIAFDNKLWYIDGNDRKVTYSKDGITWNLATDNPAFPALIYFTSVVKDDTVLVIAGASNGTNNFQDDVWLIN